MNTEIKNYLCLKQNVITWQLSSRSFFPPHALIVYVAATLLTDIHLLAYSSEFYFNNVVHFGEEFQFTFHIDY